MATLEEFLRARLDEDAGAARAACWDEHSGVWAASPPRDRYERYTVVDYLGDGVVVVTPENADDDGVGQHIARHDPARVLAETNAKRQLLSVWRDPDSIPAYDRDEYFEAVGVDRAVRLLAAVYDQHPDYREEWRPSC